MKASLFLAIASVALAATVQEVVDNLFDKYLPQKATWEEVKACRAKCNEDEGCLAACPKHECPFQRISQQCDLFNSSMAATKACHQACEHDFACHFKCPMAMPTSMKELKAIEEAMTCHTQCSHDHACHKNCNCPWKQKHERCEKLKAVVTCMKAGGSHATCPHLDKETKTLLMQEPWSLAKDVANHVADYLLPQQKEVSHEEVKACHMKCGWEHECHHKCPGGPWKKLKEECDTLEFASACHHACKQSETKCPFKKTECHFKCPMSMPSSVKELKGLTDHVLCHTACGQDTMCHATCPNSNWDEKQAQCKKYQEVVECHKGCGRDRSCHHNCPHGEWHHGHHEGGHWHHGPHENGEWHHGPHQHEEWISDGPHYQWHHQWTAAAGWQWYHEEGERHHTTNQNDKDVIQTLLV